MQKTPFRAVFSSSASEIKKHFTRAVKVKSARGFVLLSAPLEKITSYQRFVVVPTKKCRNAVTRNRLKRIVKHTLWEAPHLWQQSSQHIYLLICSPAIMQYQNGEIERILRALLPTPLHTETESVS